MDRRRLIAGLSGLGLIGCDSAPLSRSVPAMIEQPLDLSRLEAAGGRLGVCASTAGARAAWRSDERFVYCSTFKVFLASATLIRVQQGLERLDREIAITPADIVPHSPVTGPQAGGAMTVQALCQATVDISDNAAANLLIRELGGLEAFQGFYRGLGDTVTRVDRSEPAMNQLDGDKDTTTPGQAHDNLDRLFRSPGSPLSASSHALLMGWLFGSPTGPNRIRAGVPQGWRVAHKTGTGGYGPTHDIGLAYPPEGEPVVIAVYFHGPEQASAEANDAVIAEATRLALGALGHG